MEASTRTLICRTGWCDICAKENRPHTGQRFVTYGTRGKYFIYHTDHIPRRYGFTPHFYQLIKSIGNGDIIYRTICCMEDCGVYMEDNADTGKVNFSLIEEHWRREVMVLPDWNALVQRFKQDPDYFI